MQRLEPAHGDALSDGDEFANRYALPHRSAERNACSNRDSLAHRDSQLDAKPNSQRNRHLYGDAIRDALTDCYAVDYAASRFWFCLRQLGCVGDTVGGR